MLQEVRLTNFKCFKNETIFPLASINLLTGNNGKGKSSFLQSLLLIKQTIEVDINAAYLNLNGEILHLGNYDEVKNKENSQEDLICFEFRNTQHDNTPTRNYIYFFLPDKDKLSIQKCHVVVIENGQQRIFVIQKHYNNGNYYSATTQKGNDARIGFVKLKPETYISSTTMLYSSIPDIYNFTFIAADRIGPKDFYHKHTERNDVKHDGSNTANVLAEHQHKLVHTSLYRGENAQTLIDQVGEWLSYVFDTPNIKIELDESNPFIISLRFVINQQRFLPTNVGFGYSYILPIIVAGLLANHQQTNLIIENPEAHLHPRAQARLTEFLSIVASCDVQIFIESHSEHILNALRIAALNPNINIEHNNISVLYFSADTTQPIHIPIAADGGINDWPDGFFDQNDKDYKILFGF